MSIIYHEKEVTDRFKIEGIVLHNDGGVVNLELLKTRKESFYYGKCSKCNQEFFAGTFDDLLNKIEELQSDINKTMETLEDKKKLFFEKYNDPKSYALTRNDIDSIWIDIEELIKQEREKILDMIANDHGWEESRDAYAKKLGLSLKYKAK